MCIRDSGDTVTLGWEQFAVGLNQESWEELEYLFREWEMERDPEEMIRESMAPVRQVAIGPMLEMCIRDSNWTVPDTDCNLPIFASGWCDVYYPVYCGYDAKGEVCAVYVLSLIHI